MFFRLYLIGLFILLCIFFSCNDESTSPEEETNGTVTEIDTGIVTDIDGNLYKTVKIGEQWWMAENLKVTHYRNGDAIPNIIDNSQWGNLTTGAYCNYDNDDSNIETYGLLYNWHAVNNSLDIAPAGWHVPNDEDWQTLEDYLGGKNIAGGKMKATGTIEGGDGLWYSPNADATDSSGFSTLPGGYRYFVGSFSNIGYSASFWSATEISNLTAWGRYLSYSYSNVICSSYNRRYGFSVRCVKN